MIRGTTPIHTFTTNIDTALIDKLKIIYTQDEKEILTKTKDDCTLSGNAITTTLSQEETFKFDCKNIVRVQLRVKTLGGEVLATDPITVEVGKCFDSEVL